jgi:hypothetical protein
MDDREDRSRAQCAIDHSRTRFADAAERLLCTA